MPGMGQRSFSQRTLQVQPLAQLVRLVQPLALLVRRIQQLQARKQGQQPVRAHLL